MEPAAHTLGRPPGIGVVTTAAEGSRLPVRIRDAVGRQAGAIVVGAHRRVAFDRWSYHDVRPNAQLLVGGDSSPVA